MGSLWLFAASANAPTIPPWRPDEPNSLRGDRLGHQAEARVDHEYEYDIDDTTAAAFADVDDEFGRRST